MGTKYHSFTEIQQVLERYCVYQDRCHYEVEQKLQSFQLVPEAKEKILLHLMQHDFLNEERFALNYAQGKFRHKKWGRYRIKMGLSAKGISDYLVNKALKEIDKEAYHATLYRLAQKKLLTLNGLQFYECKKKLSDFLIQKGYEYELVYDQVDQLLKEKPL